MNNPAFDSSPIAEDDEYDAIKYQPTPHHLMPQVSESFPRINSNLMLTKRKQNLNVETESNIDKELGVGYAITPNLVPDLANQFNEIDEFLMD